jgi:hypothetical protein
MNSLPNEIQANIWKVYFGEHVLQDIVVRVNTFGEDAWEISLDKRNFLYSIYLEFDTPEEDPTSNLFQVCLDYGDINYYDWEINLSSVNFPDSMRRSYVKHNSRL